MRTIPDVILTNNIQNMIRKALCLALGAALWAGSAQAISFTDSNPADVRLDANSALNVFGVWVPNPLYNPSYTGNWDLLNEGYDPATQQINSAVATFSLNDANGRSESYTITIDGDTFLSGGSFSTTTFGTIDFAGGVVGDALITLDSTGLLSYTVTATSGVFWLANAALTADVSARESNGHVPDGGLTVAMLGIGLAGLGRIRRML